MKTFLVRKISNMAHRRIRKKSRLEHISMNQLLVRFLIQVLEIGAGGRREIENRNNPFRRLEELRERLHRKYGKMEDSTKLIREDRDTRE